MRDASPEPEIGGLLARMTLDRKVGQMFLLAFAGADPERAAPMIREHFIGGCYISHDNAATPKAACALSRRLQEIAVGSGAGIPLLLGADQEGAWAVMVPDSTTGPGNLGLGAAGSPRITAAMYCAIGEELRDVGYNTLFAPCVDVNSNPRNSIIGMRSFGQDPRAVARHARAAVRGAHAGGVIATAKHFPGHGDTGMDSHRNIPRVDRNRAEVQRIDLWPYRAAIRAGVDIVMTSHILFPAFDPENPATLSRPILVDLLRGRMGFRGLIISDSMNMGAMRRNYEPADAAVRAVKAGVDMIMLAEEHYDHDSVRYTENQLAGINGIIAAVRGGTLPAALIDAAVTRILRLKMAHGILQGPVLHPQGRSVGSPAHRATERAASERLVVRVRDGADLWPLPRDSRIALVQAPPVSAYRILTSTRGIGPNQAEPAFTAFQRVFCGERPDARVFSYESLAGIDLGTLDSDFDAVVAVTEDYPLPGVDFDTEHQGELVRRLLAVLGKKLVVVGLRTPYELSAYAGLFTYICTCSSRPCAAEAAARAACGLIRSRGKLPVAVRADGSA